MGYTRLLMLFGVLMLLLLGSLVHGYSLTQTVEREHPPVGEFVIVDDLRLHYFDTGKSNSKNGESTVVLLHGASTSLLDFRQNLLTSLSPSHRVLAFDRPGLGYSDRAKTWADPAEQARLIIQGLKQLGVDEAVWIGHSWAGSVVLAALLDHPEQVTAGVLLAGASHPWDSGVSWHVALSNQPVIGWLFNHLIVPIAGPRSLEGAVQSVFNPDLVPDGYIEATGIRLSLRPQTFGHNAMDVYRLSNWLQEQSARYESVTQPLLLITGTADTVVPSWNHAARLSASVPTAVWHRLNGAGHALHHSRPEEVVSQVQHFLSNRIR